MDITPLIPKEKKVINAYGSNSFTINNEKFSGNIILFPENILKWDIQEEITSISDFTLITSDKANIEILLIGTGDSHKILDRKLLSELKTYGFSVDFMSTGAACRTYNILLAEGRKVAAALLATS
jgi:uncharacterized protein